MSRLIRLVIGLVILVVGGVLLVRYSETAFLSLVGKHTDATVVGTCSQEKVLIAKRAPSCPATWGTSPGVHGRIVGADVASGDVIPVQIVDGNAYVVPTGTTDVVLGYVAPIVMAIGFGIAVARGSRRT
jgi:hypothetical protein